MHKNISRKKAKYDGKKLTDDNVKSEYTVEVQNRFNALQAQIEEEQHDADMMYNAINDSHKETAEKHIPKKE